MVGGDDYAASSFNLATQGQRQPGSAFKPFVLAEALRQHISPGSLWSSRKKVFTLKGGEKFEVNNYDDAYAGVTTLANATTHSDNSVYAELGLRLGPKKVARMARRLGIRTPVSRNAANALGGLRQGVTPLDMAHAYETFAERGRLTYGTMSPNADSRRALAPPGPVGVRAIGRGTGKDFEPLEDANGDKLVNHVRTRQVLDPANADQIQSILETVVKSGTAVRAQVPGVTIAGKTGTTEGYGDAWFVGWTPEYTIAIWVGYPDKFRPMETEFNGDPVAGGTFPAGIFKTFVESLVAKKLVKKHEPEPVPAAPGTVAPAPAPSSGAAPAPASGGSQTAPTPAAAAPAQEGGTVQGGGAPPAPAQPPPRPAPPEQPAAPQPAAPPSGGGQTGPGDGTG